ncbi:hypothetical protein R5R35_005487 [Gryllus longicercus]|uniref:Uncharacterized protein n=1 Tax=Gryllus longicercus TaxID=2509291 RepID=A0AAN9ZD82_9ORTH
MDVSSLIDLNSTLDEGVTSVPLLPLPRINSPYEGDVSNDENNPFDWAVQAVSDIDDPFELVFKKAQELESKKSDHSACEDTILKCKKVKNEMGVLDSKNSREIGNNDKKESECKKGIAQYQNNHKILKCITPDVVQSANYLLNAQQRNQSDSSETLKPKYCSTPVHHVAGAKRKLEEEYSPISSKKPSSSLFNISPASVVKARVEKCIAEAEKRFKKHSQEREKLNGRQSLDSLMPHYVHSSYQRDLTFQCDPSSHEKYSLDFVSSEDSKNKLTHSFRNLQKPKNIGNFSEETFTLSHKVDSHAFRRSWGPEDDLSQHEARFMATLLKATADYQGHTLANESVVTFVDLDSEEEDGCEEKKKLEEIKEKLSAEFQPTNPVNFEVLKDHTEIKMPKRVQRSPETVLGKMQSFSPRKSTSSPKERDSVESSGGVNGKLPSQISVNRSRSDSTIHSLKKKEQMEKPSKWALKETSRFSNAVQSPQTKQKQAVNSGRVIKPPKPLPKMFRNKKNLLTGKENKP